MSALINRYTDEYQRASLLHAHTHKSKVRYTLFYMQTRPLTRHARELKGDSLNRASNASSVSASGQTFVLCFNEGYFAVSSAMMALLVLGTCFRIDSGQVSSSLTVSMVSFSPFNPQSWNRSTIVSISSSSLHTTIILYIYM